MDLGCGTGIFGLIILEKLLKQKLKVEKMTFSDYQSESVKICKFNIEMNENIF